MFFSHQELRKLGLCDSRFLHVEYIANRVKIKRYNSYILGSAYCSKKGSANLASPCSTVDCRNSTSYKVISAVFSLSGLEAMF